MLPTTENPSTFAQALEAENQSNYDKALLAGLAVGRNVHYILPSGEHCPAIIQRVPGLLFTNAVEADGTPVSVPAPEGSGFVGVSVFLAPSDEFAPGATGDLLGYAPGAPFDPTGKTPHTWHWIERA